MKTVNYHPVPDIEQKRQPSVSDPTMHAVDHGALWEAIIYLNRRVMWLEDQLEKEDV